MVVYKFILKKGYKPKYSTVSDFLNKNKKIQIKKATVRFETKPRLKDQLDWKECLTLISKYGEVFKINIFLMVLGYSMIKFVKATYNTDQMTLFSCMIDDFQNFGVLYQERFYLTI